MFLGCFGFIVVVGIFVNLDIFKDWVWEIRVFGRLDFFFLNWLLNIDEYI